MYLDYATRQARRHIPMTMEDWKTKLDAFLRFTDAEVLQDKGKVTAAIEKEFAESEFEKYRVIQDSLYESDFDKLMNDMAVSYTHLVAPISICITCSFQVFSSLPAVIHH